MKFNISAKELLALHNLLHEVTADPHGLPLSHDAVQLKQVYDRLRACVVSALTNNTPVDPIDVFFKREQLKIDKLREVATPEDKAVAGVDAQDTSGFMTPDDEDYEAPEYPRKGIRPVNRGGYKGNQKR